jgi:transcriptional regulator with XRE-family HTH domain
VGRRAAEAGLLQENGAGSAKQAGISAAYVAKLEAGRSDPTVGMLRKLANALGVPVTALLA